MLSSRKKPELMPEPCEETLGSPGLLRIPLVIQDELVQQRNLPEAEDAIPRKRRGGTRTILKGEIILTN